MIRSVILGPAAGGAGIAPSAISVDAGALGQVAQLRTGLAGTLTWAKLSGASAIAIAASGAVTLSAALAAGGSASAIARVSNAAGDAIERTITISATAAVTPTPTPTPTPSNPAYVAKMAGQSNVEGTSATAPSGWVDNPLIQVFDGTGYVTYSPGTCTGRTTTDGGSSIINKTSVGPEAGFALKWLAANSGKTLYLQVFAKGSTSLAVDWSTSGQGADLYSKATAYFQAADAALVAAGKTPSFLGFHWGQGEADASVQAYGQAYGTNLAALFARVRTDWGVAATTRISVMRIITLARPYGKHVRDWQAKVALDDPYVYLFNADDISNDGTHFTAPGGYQTMGERIYDVFAGSYADYAASVPATPTIATAAALTDPENQTVVGTVTTNAEIVGYTIEGGADAAKFAIDAALGSLSFLASAFPNGAPDYENPTDVGANNIYDVIVGATNGRGNKGTKALAVQITDVVEATYDGEAEAVALVNRMGALGATATTTGNSGFKAAAKQFYATMKTAGLLQKLDFMAKHQVLEAGGAAQPNWANPGTYDLATYNGSGTTKGSYLLKDGYKANATNAQSDNAPSGINPTSFVTSRAAQMYFFVSTAAPTTATGVQVGGSSTGGPTFRRGRVNLGQSANTSYTAAETFGFQAVVRIDNTIYVYKADGSLLSSYAVTDAAMSGTTFAAPGTTDAVLDTWGMSRQVWSGSEIQTLRDALATLRAGVAAL